MAFLKEHSTGYMALKAVSRSTALLPPVSTTLGNASSSKTSNKGGAHKLETYSIAHRVQRQWMAEAIEPTNRDRADNAIKRGRCRDVMLQGCPELVITCINTPT